MSYGKKFAYIVNGETMKFKVKDMYRTIKGSKGEYSIVGAYTLVHYAKGMKPTECTGEKCAICGGNRDAENKAQVRYRTTIVGLDEPDKEFLMDMQYSLATLIADKQKSMEELGMDKADILEKVYVVTKNPPKSVPLYAVSFLTGAKNAKAPVVQEEIEEADALDELGEVDFNDEERGALKKVSEKLVANLKQGKKLNVASSVRKSLEGSLGWTDNERIEFAITLFKEDGTLLPF
jgi:hypothetical protein